MAFRILVQMSSSYSAPPAWKEWSGGFDTASQAVAECRALAPDYEGFTPARIQDERNGRIVRVLSQEWGEGIADRHEAISAPLYSLHKPALVALALAFAPPEKLRRATKADLIEMITWNRMKR